MRSILALLALVIAAIAAPATGAEPERPAVAQSGSRCGIPPMKPSSCLGGSWVCRCYAGGQLCDWELVGCQSVPGAPRRPGETSPGTDPTRPGPLGR